MTSDLEKTLVVLKPDTIKRGIVGEIFTRFERVWLRLVGAKMVQVSEQLAYDHYETIGTVISRWGKDIFDINAQYMMSWPVLALVFEWVEAIAVVRKLVGSTSPREALPGTIRGDYAHVSREYTNQTNSWLPNIAHASANAEEAEQELALWFAWSELFDYDMLGREFKIGHK